MTGSGGGKPDIPPKPAPAARVESPDEAETAKKKTRRRAHGGRDAQILAGGLTRSANDNNLKQILG